MNMKIKSGISLIILVITIIIMIIIAAAVILSLTSDNIVGKSREAIFKNDVSALNSELATKLSERYLANSREHTWD